MGESLTPEPLLEYADYMGYQGEWLSDAYQDAMRYWQNTWRDVADSYPTDQPRQKVARYQGAFVAFIVANMRASVGGGACARVVV